jgi:hypothetical protein
MVALNLHRVGTESYINLRVGTQKKVPDNGCALWFYSCDALWPPVSHNSKTKKVSDSTVQGFDDNV